MQKMLKFIEEWEKLIKNIIYRSNIRNVEIVGGGGHTRGFQVKYFG